jgi:zinc protease
VKKFTLTALACILAAGLAWSPLAGAGRTLPVPERITLSNGLTVYVLKNPELPLVSFRMFIRGAGAAFEPADAEGAANLTAALLTKGTAGMDADAVAEALDFMGASLSFSAAEEYAQASGDSLAEHFPRLLEVASSCLAAPAFKDDEFAKEKAQRIDRLKAAKDNPGIAVRYYFQKAYFGSHPMGHLASGTEASLSVMAVGTVKDFYAKRYRPDHAIAAVVGDVDGAALKALLERTLGRWRNPAGAAGSDVLPPLPRPQGRKLLLVDKPDATQAYFILGSPGYPVGDKITPQATVMNTLWGGRFTSWLNTELRIKRGLTYGARSSFDGWAVGGLFQATSYTKNDKIGEMLDITFGLLGKAVKDGFSAEEVESARNYVLGQFPPTLETNAAKASAYARLAFYKLGFDYYDKYLAAIGKVTPAEVNAAAAALLPRNDDVLVVVGKAAEIRPLLAKFGAWKEKKITDPGF